MATYRRRGWPGATLAVAVLLLGWLTTDGLAAPAAEGPVNLSNLPGDDLSPRVAHTAGESLAVWENEGQIYYATRQGTWSGPQPVPAAFGGQPRIAVGATDTVHLVWNGVNPLSDTFDVYASTYTETGWALPVNLSESATDALEADVAANADGEVLVVWSELDASGQTLYAAFSDGGPWTVGPLLDGIPGESPAVTATDDGWALTWIDELDGNPGPDVLATQVQGSDWSAAEIVAISADNSLEDTEPAIGAGTDGVLIAWNQADLRVMAAIAPAPLEWTATVVAEVTGGVGAPAVTGGNRSFVAWLDGATLRATAREGATWTPASDLLLLPGAEEPDLFWSGPAGSGRLEAVLSATGTQAQDVFWASFSANEVPGGGVPSATPGTQEPTTATPTGTQTSGTPGTPTAETPIATQTLTTATPTESSEPTASPGTTTPSSTPTNDTDPGTPFVIYAPLVETSG